ncbi:barstar family protein [Streptomyces spinosirectus]|uniref:barstar family protein n=2 Tax=Streptomyces TaxID=1883 RepID=UPI001F2FA792|nr:barstar family protein [Streptomyces spinosirectus]UIR18829.1 barstar family protein [Streptomyces spinosirectus]
MTSSRARVLFVPGGVGASEIWQELSALEAGGGRVFHFDAHALMTEQEIFSSFAKVLQFPGYFGRNWDAMVDCLDDLCGAVTGGVGIAVVVHDADQLLETEHFPLFVSVLCQGADRANSAVDLDGFPLDRPALSEQFVFEFREFDHEEIAARIRQPDLIVNVEDRFVGAALDPEEWH